MTVAICIWRRSRKCRQEKIERCALCPACVCGKRMQKCACIKHNATYNYGKFEVTTSINTHVHCSGILSQLLIYIYIYIYIYHALYAFTF